MALAACAILWFEQATTSLRAKSAREILPLCRTGRITTMSEPRIGWLRDYVTKLRLFTHNARMVLIYSAVTGLVFGVFRLLFNFYVLSLGGYDERFLGNLTSASSVASLLMALPAVYIADRFPRKRVLVVTGLISAAAILGLVVLPYRFFLVFFNFVSGLSMSVRQVVTAPFLMSNTSDDERQYVFSFNFGLMTIAQFAGNMFGGSLPSLLGGWAGVGPTDTLAYQLTLGSMVLVSSLAIGPLMSIREQPLDPNRVITMPWVQLWRYGGQLTKLIIPQIIIGLGAGLMMPFMNLYFRNVLGRSDAVIGTLFGFGAFAMAIAQFVAPPVADRIGKIETVILSQGLSIPFLMTLGLMAWVAPQNRPGLALWFAVAAIAYLFRLSLMNLSGPVYQTFILEQVEEEAQAIAASLNSLSFQFGWAVMPSLSGWLQATYDEFGFVLIFAGVSFFYATAIVLQWVFFKRRRPSAELEMAEKPSDRQRAPVR